MSQLDILRPATQKKKNYIKVQSSLCGISLFIPKGLLYCLKNKFFKNNQYLLIEIRLHK